MKILGFLVAGVLLIGHVLAQEHPTPAPTTVQEAAHYGWADVLRVDPIYDEPAQSREECYEEQVLEAPAESDSSKRSGATVLGAIIGSIVGSRFGKGDGRKATTAAGAIAGGVVGNNLAANAGDPPPRYTTQRRCRQPDGASAQRHVVGYDVEYRYRGEVYSARLGYDPGDRMRVRVSVTPAE